MRFDEAWIGRGEAITRLGVKAQTLYAYVSRGRIAARPDPEHPRRSLYAVADLNRLLGEASPQDTPLLPFKEHLGEVAKASSKAVQPPATRGEILVMSSVGQVEGGRLFYRGKDAIQLAQSATVEDAARLLWDVREPQPFSGLGPRLDGVGAVSARGRLFAALGRRAQEDAAASGRDMADLKTEAASALNEVIDAVAGPGPRLYFHQRLGRGWKILERDAHLIRRALVLSADCGLDPAVLTTRSAAGAGASPAGAVLAGLVCVSASAEVAELNRTITYLIEARRDPVSVARRWIAADGALPGFGGQIWPEDKDPRAQALLAAADLPADLMAVIREGEAVSGRPVGLAMALAVIARRLDLPRDAASDLYLLGRVVALFGHALDHATGGSPIAARLRYVGPRPGAN